MSSLLHVYKRYSQERISIISAGVAFYGLLAIFPALVVLVSIYGLFTPPATAARHVAELSGYLPPSVLALLRGEMRHIARQTSGTLGLALGAGVVIALWSAHTGMKALVVALNVAYGERERRGFFSLNAVALLLTFVMIVFGLFAMAVIVVVPYISHLLGGSPVLVWCVRAGSWIVLLICAAAAIGMLYRWGPVKSSYRPWIGWGSIAAALAWVVISALFSWYTAHFGSYGRTYGSLGAVVVFMVWLWLSALVVIVGAMLEREAHPVPAG